MNQYGGSFLLFCCILSGFSSSLYVMRFPTKITGIKSITSLSTVITDDGFIAFNGPTTNSLATSKSIDAIGSRRGISSSAVSSRPTNQFVRSIAEQEIRDAIASNNFDTAKELLGSLNSTKLSSGRNVIYVIAETCHRTKRLQMVLPLVQAIKSPIRCKEDDILPLINKCTEERNAMKIVYPLVAYLLQKNIPFSAKTFSTMIKGFGRIQNQRMVDQTMLSLIPSSTTPVSPDIILLNTLLDAYIR